MKSKTSVLLIAIAVSLAVFGVVATAEDDVSVADSGNICIGENTVVNLSKNFEGTVTFVTDEGNTVLKVNGSGSLVCANVGGAYVYGEFSYGILQLVSGKVNIGGPSNEIFVGSFTDDEGMGYFDAEGVYGLQVSEGGLKLTGTVKAPNTYDAYNGLTNQMLGNSIYITEEGKVSGKLGKVTYEMALLAGEPELEYGVIYNGDLYTATVSGNKVTALKSSDSSLRVSGLTVGSTKAYVTGYAGVLDIYDKDVDFSGISVEGTLVLSGDVTEAKNIDTDATIILGTDVKMTDVSGNIYLYGNGKARSDDMFTANVNGIVYNDNGYVLSSGFDGATEAAVKGYAIIPDADVDDISIEGNVVASAIDADKFVVTKGANVCLTKDADVTDAFVTGAIIVMEDVTASFQNVNTDETIGAIFSQGAVKAKRIVLDVLDAKDVEADTLVAESCFLTGECSIGNINCDKIIEVRGELVSNEIVATTCGIFGTVQATKISGGIAVLGELKDCASCSGDYLNIQKKGKAVIDDVDVKEMVVNGELEAKVVNAESIQVVGTITGTTLTADSFNLLGEAKFDTADVNTLEVQGTLIATDATVTNTLNLTGEMVVDVLYCSDVIVTAIGDLTINKSTDLEKLNVIGKTTFGDCIVNIKDLSVSGTLNSKAVVTVDKFNIASIGIYANNGKLVVNSDSGSLNILGTITSDDIGELEMVGYSDLTVTGTLEKNRGTITSTVIEIKGILNFGDSNSEINVNTLAISGVAEVKGFIKDKSIESNDISINKDGRLLIDGEVYVKNMTIAGIIQFASGSLIDVHDYAYISYRMDVGDENARIKLEPGAYAESFEYDVNVSRAIIIDSNNNQAKSTTFLDRNHIHVVQYAAGDVPIHYEAIPDFNDSDRNFVAWCDGSDLNYVVNEKIAGNIGVIYPQLYAKFDNIIHKIVFQISEGVDYFIINSGDVSTAISTDGESDTKIAGSFDVKSGVEYTIMMKISNDYRVDNAYFTITSGDQQWRVDGDRFTATIGEDFGKRGFNVEAHLEPEKTLDLVIIFMGAMVVGIFLLVVIEAARLVKRV